MNKEGLNIKLLPNTKEKLKVLKTQTGLSIGQIIDIMTRKQKLNSLIK